MTGRHRGILSVLAVTVTAFGLAMQPITAGAAYMGRLGNDQGFFDTNYWPSLVYGDSVMPSSERCDYTTDAGTGWNERPRGQDSEYSAKNALPYSDVSTKQKYGAYLQARYNSNRCGGWDRLGVTFVVRTMLGHQPGTPRTLSSADWNEFYEKIINNDLVEMEFVEETQSRYNTHSTGFHAYGTQEDMLFYTIPSGQAVPVDQSLLFEGPNGYRYEIKLRCANPTGDMRTNVTVLYDFELIPNVSNSLQQVVEPGAELTVGSNVRNTGTTVSRDARWQLSQVVLAPGSSSPGAGGGTSGSEPCGFYSGGDCQRVAGGNRVFGTGTTNMPSANVAAGDLEVGTKICFGLSVQPRRHDDDSWQHSSLRCTTIGKKPKLQVWGGDTAVRGQIRTSTSRKSGLTYGSWGEYGVLSAGTNNDMASGGGLAGGNPSGNRSYWGKLTFANVSGYGSYTNLNSRALPDVAARLVASPQPLGDSIGDINALDGIYSRSGNLSIGGGTLAKGKTVIIRATGTVTITQSLLYTSDSLASAGEIPQLVIIAGNINIENGVERIDAWLVAPAGTINTCSDYASVQLTSGVCNKQLRVNGPVIANKLNLRRTFGSGTGDQSGEPAEIFNLRADAYLWAQARAGGSGRAQTVMMTEMPPRF